jgi:hypothetical protein
MKQKLCVAEVISKVRDFILGVLGLICIVFAIASTLADKLPAAGTLFTAGLLLCIFSSLSRFESIKGLGIEAKMAALDTKLNEADHLLKHIRNAVGLSADVSFQVMGRIGRWDADVPKKEALEIADRFSEQLRALGADKDEINHSMAPWHSANLADLARPLHQEMYNLVHLRNQELTAISHKVTPANETNPEWIKLQDAFKQNTAFLTLINERWEYGVLAFANEAEELLTHMPAVADLEKRELLNRIKPMIEDIKFYHEHKQFRDRQRWLDQPYS